LGRWVAGRDDGTGGWPQQGLPRLLPAPAAVQVSGAVLRQRRRLPGFWGIGSSGQHTPQQRPRGLPAEETTSAQHPGTSVIGLERAFSDSCTSTTDSCSPEGAMRVHGTRLRYVHQTGHMCTATAHPELFHSPTVRAGSSCANRLESIGLQTSPVAGHPRGPRRIPRRPRDQTRVSTREIKAERDSSPVPCVGPDQGHGPGEIRNASRYRRLPGTRRYPGSRLTADHERPGVCSRSSRRRRSSRRSAAGRPARPRPTAPGCEASSHIEPETGLSGRAEQVRGSSSRRS